MNTQPLVSVVIPSYNHEKYITESIESVIKQTYKNIELFVIDDGSSDNSPRIIEALSKEHHFWCLCRENKGHLKTANELYAMCNGKYICCIASDDIWTLDKVEKQVAFMEENPQIAACYGNILNINQYGEILPFYQQYFSKYKTYSFDDIVMGRQYIYAITEMIRKEVFEKVGPFDENYMCEDFNLWLKLTHASYQVACLKNLMGFYRSHSTNISKNRKPMHEARIAVLKQFKTEKIYRKGILNAYRHYYLHITIDLFRKLIRLGK